MEIKIDPQKSRLFKDLLDYTGLNEMLALRRCDYAVTELAILWDKKKSVLDFYREAELYIFDLTKYQLILESNQLVNKMINQIENLKLKKILEFGGGIGEFSVLCSEKDFDITYYDLDGEIKNYALWRFNKHQCDIKVAEKYPLDQQWDLVNMMDVLEHLENPQEVISDLSKNTDYIFCNPEEVKYNVFFPQHISKFDLGEYFELVEGYLWKNKNNS